MCRAKCNTHVVPIEVADEGTGTENFVQAQGVLSGHQILLHMDEALEVRPTALRVSFLIRTSSASSTTRFLYWSKPRILPSVRMSSDLHPISLLEVTEDLIDG